jgi:hypothetical protein
MSTRNNIRSGKYVIFYHGLHILTINNNNNNNLFICLINILKASYKVSKSKRGKQNKTHTQTKDKTRQVASFRQYKNPVR